MKNTTCLGTAMVSLMLFTGCAITITQNYEHKISMTRIEAVQRIKRSWPSWLVNESGYDRTYPGQVVDRTCETDIYGRPYKSPFNDQYRIQYTQYHLEDCTVRVVFADATAIKKEGDWLKFYNYKGVLLDSIVTYRYERDEIISAFLALCPNVGPASSNVAIKEGAGQGAEPKSKDDVVLDEIFDLIKQGNVNKVKSVLDVNPKLVNSNNDGVTPLHVAAVNGYRDIAELLIAKGADVNARDYRGRTPLHIAAISGTSSRKQGCIEVAELLIAKGAKVNAKANNGSTPLHCAYHNGLVADLLRQHGGVE